MAVLSPLVTAIMSVLLGSMGMQISGESLSITSVDDVGVKNDDCVFPFEYKGTMHNYCTKSNANHLWCSKHAVYKGDWVYCAKKAAKVDDTKDKFANVLKQLEKQEELLKQLEAKKKAKGCTCNVQIDLIRKSIRELKEVFKDHGRRLDNLEKRVDKIKPIDEMVREIRKVWPKILTIIKDGGKKKPEKPNPNKYPKLVAPDTVKDCRDDGKTCYLFVSKELKWREANNHCAKHKARLTSVDDEDTNLFLTSKTSLISTGPWFLGINDIVKEGIYKSTNYEPALFSNWAPGEPNNAAKSYQFPSYYIKKILKRSRRSTDDSVDRTKRRAIRIHVKSKVVHVKVKHGGHSSRPKWIYGGYGDLGGYFKYKRGRRIKVRTYTRGKVPYGYTRHGRHHLKNKLGGLTVIRSGKVTITLREGGYRVIIKKGLIIYVDKWGHEVIKGKDGKWIRIKYLICGSPSVIVDKEDNIYVFQSGSWISTTLNRIKRNRMGLIKDCHGRKYIIVGKPLKRILVKQIIRPSGDVKFPIIIDTRGKKWVKGKGGKFEPYVPPVVPWKDLMKKIDWKFPVIIKGKKVKEFVFTLRIIVTNIVKLYHKLKLKGGKDLAIEFDIDNWTKLYYKKLNILISIGLPDTIWEFIVREKLVEIVKGQEDCVRLGDGRSSSPLWYDVQCDLESKFICQLM